MQRIVAAVLVQPFEQIESELTTGKFARNSGGTAFYAARVRRDDCDRRMAPMPDANLIIHAVNVVLREFGVGFVRVDGWIRLLVYVWARILSASSVS